ncbi:MAG: RNA-guided endonuclease InsQ/TnpB family protein, partial [Candidatus Binatia bacterium]
CYADLRARFGLSAQMAVRAIGKAVEVFRRDKRTCPTFQPDGAMTYDERIMSFKGMDRVSLLTLEGRQLIPLVFGEYQRERFDRIKGQCDVVVRKGKFFLYCTIDVPEPPQGGVKKFLGIDLGIVNIATTSEGQTFSGEQIERCRRRHAKARQQFQRCNTRGARRRLKQMSRRQRRFQTTVNHTISKQLAAFAKALNRGLALEDLTNIRTRIEHTARRKQRARLSNWAFRQLREFIAYKAKLAGVPVCFVDPRNSSRECSQCSYTDKANRKTQADFLCGQCGYAAHADFNAASVLAARGAVNRSD